MLAACLYLWDIAWGVEKPAFREDWLVKVSHVERAYLLLSQIFHRIRPASVCASVPVIRVCGILLHRLACHRSARVSTPHALLICDHPCEGDAGMWPPGAAGQEAPANLHGAGGHPGDTGTADGLQVHRVDEVSRRPSVCVCVTIRLCEWSPFASNLHCHTGVIRMQLSMHHHTRPTGDSSLAVGGTMRSPSSTSRLTLGWCSVSRRATRAVRLVACIRSPPPCVSGIA